MTPDTLPEADATAQEAPHDWLAAEALGGPLADLLDMAVETVDMHMDRLRDGDLSGELPLDLDRLAGLQDAIAMQSARFEPSWRTAPDQPARAQPAGAGTPEPAADQASLEEIRASLREVREVVRELTENRARRRYF